MNPRRSFVRKIAYLAAIALLLIPLFWLSQPATSGGEGSPGGKLARLRAENDLSEAQLGEIDPTSETIKLATLGMRGVAANVLWSKANSYEMKKDWVNLSATLNQIAKLEPHFITVWRHQAWKVSYNISSQFDDYRIRYRWVIKGIEFLKEGMRYNQYEPELYWDVGWFNAQKIGRADESKQFRRLFREDDDYHGARPLVQRDNWLVGKEWFRKAEKLGDEGKPLRGMTPALFYSESAMCQMNYSEAWEKDGNFGEKARLNWKKAAEEWFQYGSRDVPTSSGITVRLNDYETLRESVREMQDRLDDLGPGVREKIEREKRAALTDAEREAIDTPPNDRDEPMHKMAYEAEQKLHVTNEEVARRVPTSKRAEARDLARRLTENEQLAQKTNSYRNLVNFVAWRRRAQVEQLPETLEAREWIYKGKQAVEQALLPESKEYYDAGLAKWREVLDNKEIPDLAEDEILGPELMDVVNEYRRLLDERDEPFPENFILQDIVDLYGHRL